MIDSPPSSPKVNRCRIAWVWRLPFMLGLLLIGLAMLFSFAGRLGFPFDLACNFRVYYALGSAVCAAGLLIGRAWRCATIAGVMLAVNLWLAGPIWPWGATDEPAAVRLLVANVHASNTAHNRLLALIDQTDPDVIGLVEVNRRWLDALEPLRERYPFRLTDPRADNFGLAVLSRLPLRHGRTVQFTDERFSSVIVELTWPRDGEPVTFVLMHPPPPIRAALSEARDRQIRAVSKFVRSQQGPVIVAGDFNATPWTPSMAALLSDTGLQNPRHGRGLIGTWPATLPAAFRLPIDHIFASPSLDIGRFESAGEIGSDHLPILADVERKKPR